MVINIQKIKDVWGRLLHEDATPNQVAAGFAIGFMISFIPLPCQTILALALAFSLHLNKVACLVGVHLHLTVFPVIPVVFFSEYYVGKILFPYHRMPELETSHFELHTLLRQGWPVLRATLLGALVLGIPSSVLAFFGVRQAAIRWQKNRTQAAAAANSSLDKTLNDG